MTELIFLPLVFLTGLILIALGASKEVRSKGIKMAHMWDVVVLIGLFVVMFAVAKFMYLKGYIGKRISDGAKTESQK